MKNALQLKSICLALIFLCAMNSVSQEINFGAKVGLNLASLRGDYPDGVDEIKPIVGFHIGGFAEYVVNEQISIQPELLFSRQGVNTKVNENANSFSQAPRLNYLNLALMGTYKVLEKLAIEIGPQIGYTLSAKSKWEYEDGIDSSNNETVELDLRNGGTVNFLGGTIEGDGRIKKFDFGLNLGASYELNEHMFVQIRSNLGLSVVDKNSTSSTSLDSWNLKNTVLQLSFGYLF